MFKKDESGSGKMRDEGAKLIVCEADEKGKSSLQNLTSQLINNL